MTLLATLGGVSDIGDINASLGQLERRDWWLWGTTILLMLLLWVAVASLGISILMGENDPLFELDIDLAIRGLLGMVFLFSAYAVHQQVQVKGRRRHLTEQIGLTHRLGAQAKEFHQLAMIDPLSGLSNRRLMEEHMKAELSRSDRHAYPLTALLIDLDGFKEINDTFGHVAGDRVIKEFARRLRKAVRGSDLPARIGGDEFLVLLPECATELVPRVLSRLSDIKVDFDGNRIPVRFSAGWTGYRPGQSAEQLLERADKALYANKQSGIVRKKVSEVQTQLRQAQKMEVMGRLAAGVAHDFNNQLTVIKGYCELLAQRLSKSDHGQRMVREVLKAADHGVSLTRQLLAFSRQQKLEPKVLDLNALVSDKEGMLRRLVGEDIEIVTALHPRLGRVNADPVQLQQVIVNLAANARDAMREGGRLTIGTANAELDTAFVRRNPGSRPGPQVCLSMSDTGAGMDKPTQARIFEPFFTTKEQGKGTGIGLATIYGIVKQSGGYIRVDSEIGRGTTFRIYMPRVEQEANSRIGIARQ